MEMKCEISIPEKIVKVLLSEGSRVKSFNTKEPTLEEAFITLTGGEEEETASYVHISCIDFPAIR